ncbi:MAG: LysR family transcriptional regulator [Paracoccaceae bacterium]|nr:LysR family transcriptional regulator [Paracoccaceae bacterium]MDG1369575.1 LysR family transcriptional regulator [Paracoccaceae bacterium]
MNNALQSIDFAALETLRLVNRHRSFTAAAAELKVKQSSVSYTIGRLRTAFGDPLFVRQGNRVFATDRCLTLVETAERVIHDMELAALPVEFFPRSVEVTITISVTYLSRTVLLPALVKELRQEAPGISIELITGFSDASQHLLSGTADMALSPVGMQESGVLGKFLLEDPYVCLMDPGNDLANGDLTLDRFASASHLVIHYGQNWQPPFLQKLQEQGLDITATVSTPNPEDVRLLVPDTDLIVTMPSRIAHGFAPHFLIRKCPVPSAAELNFYWPARLNNSPLHIWIRDKIFRLARQAKLAGPVIG